MWPLPEHEPQEKPVDIRNGKTVLVFSFSTEEELNAIRTFMTVAKQYRNNSMAVAYSSEINLNILKDDISIFYISQNDFNLLGRIKKRFDDWLTDNDFDLLLSFVYNSELFCDKIVSSINSDFKAGNFDKGNVGLFDLTIKQKPDNYNEQFKQFNYYIDKLNISI